jgi:thiamine pyrophosphate-dependent acetolactate synthase large subunit-like protein
MTRQDVVDALVAVRGDAPVISGPGTISRLLFVTKHQAATIYQMDLAYATSMSLGVALARPDKHRVVGIEGDGSIIAALGVFTTIARYRPKNLVSIIVDDGVYGSVVDGTLETGTKGGTDLAAVAKACGVRNAVSVDNKDDAASTLRRAFGEPGPWVIVMKVDTSDRMLMRDRRGIISFDIVETAQNYRRELVQ